jgi:hypothetical protein
MAAVQSVKYFENREPDWNYDNRRDEKCES